MQTEHLFIANAVPGQVRCDQSVLNIRLLQNRRAKTVQPTRHHYQVGCRSHAAGQKCKEGPYSCPWTALQPGNAVRTGEPHAARCPGPNGAFQPEHSKHMHAEG